MKIVGIIQARMSSSRLPGKVLMEVKGKPLLQWQIERLARSSMMDSLVVATTSNPGDSGVCSLSEKLGVTCHRGSENDVLDRMYLAAIKADADIVIRLTGDCPLVDITVCDSLIRFFLDSEADYANTSPHFAEGLDCEVMKISALDKAWKEATLSSEREHVTLYIRNSGLFDCKVLDNDRDDSKYRITVDEEADFKVVRHLFEQLKDPVTDQFDSVRAILDRDKDIFALNSSIIRNEGMKKSLETDSVFIPENN